MKIYTILCGAAVALSTFLTACTVPTPTETDAKAREWSGTVPPLYYRWGETEDRNNFVFPFVYWNDEGDQCYSLFGWDTSDPNKKIYYYLTPLLLSTTIENGIAENNMLLFQYRNIDQKLHPEASSFDFNFWPLVNWKTTTQVHGVKQNLLQIGSDLCLYADGKTEVATPHYTMSETKTGYAGYAYKEKVELIGTGSARVTKTHNGFPFYWNEQEISKQEVAGPFKGAKPEILNYQEDATYIFPFYYENSALGKCVVTDRSGQSMIQNADGYNILCFPFFQYKRIHQNYMTHAACLLFIYNWDAGAQRDLYNILWFFQVEDTPDNSSFGFLGDFFRIQTGKQGEFHLCWFKIIGDSEETPSR